MTNKNKPVFADSVPSTADEAKSRGLKYFFTGIECPRGHLSVRDTTHDNKCRDCILEVNRKAQRTYAKTAKSKEKQKVHVKNWTEKNREYVRAYDRVEYYQKQLNKALSELSDIKLARKD